jgi:DNA-binding GntR family transcriptional regulator
MAVTTSKRPASRRQTAHEQVRDALRHEITTGQLPGGARLIQAEIAEQLGFSITPVREALRDLATEGLVRFDAHRGAVVHQVGVSEMREIYEMRRRLEPLVVERAVGLITPDQIAHARSLHEAMLPETDPGRWMALNRDFHYVIIDACGWARLATTVKQLHASAGPYVTLTMQFRPDYFARANREHGQMLDAIEGKDVERAVEVMTQHMDITKFVIEHQLGDGADHSEDRHEDLAED